MAVAGLRDYRCALYGHGPLAHHLRARPLSAKIAGVLRGYLRRLRDVFRIRNFDAVYIHMWVTPLGPCFMEWVTRNLARKVIYDIEDNILMEQTLPAAQHRTRSSLSEWARQSSLPDPYRDHVITSVALSQRLLPAEKTRRANAHTYRHRVDTDPL